MMFLETIVQTRWAEAIGWTLIHSLWQGFIAAAVLGMIFLVTQSPRVRYAAGMAAMLVMVIAFGVTLFALNSHNTSGGLPVRPVPFPIRRPPVPQSAGGWEFGLSAIAPWLAPFWFTGVFLFYARYVAGFVSLARLSMRGVCVAPEVWLTRLDNLRAKVEFRAPFGCWNRHLWKRQS